MSKKVTVLLLGYRSQAGKDTFYSFSKDQGWVRAAFADKLKSTVMDLYGFSHEQMHGDLKDVMDPRYPNLIDPKDHPDWKPFFTPRRILQIFGQNQRALFPRIWASYVFNSTVPSLVGEGHDTVIVTDFRFKNEAAVALEWEKQDPEHRSLRLIRIDRDIEAASGASDISEHELDDFTGWTDVLDNNSSLEDYQRKVKDFLRQLS